MATYGLTMRLTPAEIKHAQEWLTCWHTPQEVREGATRLMDKLGDEHIFQQAGVSFIYEAYAAAQFAEFRHAAFLRKIAGERPDTELKFSCGSTEIFEVVEADKLGRKRGDEYKELYDKGTMHLPHFKKPLH